MTIPQRFQGLKQGLHGPSHISDSLYRNPKYTNIWCLDPEGVLAKAETTKSGDSSSSCMDPVDYPGCLAVLLVQLAIDSNDPNDRPSSLPQATRP